MSRQFTQNEKKLLNDQMVIRAMCPRDTVKWLAQLMSISLHAARVWAERTVPVYRREEFGLRLLEEYYRQDKHRKETILPAILKMAGLAYEGESVPEEDGVAADTTTNIIRALQARVEAAIDWLEE
jgi:hypothetical protein